MTSKGIGVLQCVKTWAGELAFSLIAFGDDDHRQSQFAVTLGDTEVLNGRVSIDAARCAYSAVRQALYAADPNR